ncbi:hypothetical protein MPDQ_004910 [Monascus purpureus]|uniref:MARVEL domain-containing protein n=1 Tax=Monascus purpureus TaxID=5098 RepID=A0A507QGS1_MONPU|nr:hypothetical protein MPDQ_004910 [Monascus purpureus]BDD62164.1 hypothetical protein MAP00_007147 [Monascus purpureus]
MRLPSVNPARTKNILHGIQGLIIFLAWALTIAVFTKGGGIDGRSAWYWALCWFSIPGLIYLMAVPIWPRARRFGNMYAFATVDWLYAVLWFAAWVAVATYVAEGPSDTSNDKDKDKSTGCGSESKCHLSTATVILGVVVFLLFVATGFISFRNVAHFRRTGTLPDMGTDATFAAQTKDAFSSNPGRDFDEEDDFRSGRGGMGSSTHSNHDEDYALLHQSELDDFGPARTPLQGGYDPTGPGAGGMHDDYNTSYGGAHGQHFEPPSPSVYSTPYPR